MLSDERKAAMIEYNKANRDKIKAANKRYKTKLIRARKRMLKLWIEAHPKAVAAFQAAYAANQAKKQRAYNRRYQREHPRMYEAYAEEHRKERAFNSRNYIDKNKEMQRGHSKFKNELKHGKFTRPKVCSKCAATDVKIVASSLDRWATTTNFEWLCYACFSKKKRIDNE